MNLFTSISVTYLRGICIAAFWVIMLPTAFQPPAFGQRTGTTGSGTNSPATSQGISGSDITSSEITSKMGEMPRFKGFDRLDKTTYIGATGAYFPPRISSGQRLSSGQQASSGNTRTTTTGSRTTRSTSTMRNRNTSTMGNTGRTGGFGGTNTDTVRSVTSLGYSFYDIEAARPTEAVRISQLENRINNSKVRPLGPIVVEMENSTAILRGVVKNEHDRKLLEQLAKLEPGISKVQNELTLPSATK